MRILHLLSQRPDATGSGIYLQAMVGHAAARGWDNFLVAGVPRGFEPAVGGLGPGQSRLIRFDGADLCFPIVGMSDVMPYPSRRFADLTDDQVAAYETCFADRLAAAVGAFKPDLIHSHHLWLVTALARRHHPDLPIVTTCHGSDLRQFQNCPHLARRVAGPCRQLDGVLALSVDQKHRIQSLYGIAPERIAVTGAGYNQSIFFPVPKPAPEPVRILYAGKLSRAKGVPWLLNALGRIDRPDWHLDLVGGGSGPEKAQCLELAARLGPRVTARGPLDQPALAGLLRRAHLFVLPSFFEGLPLVLLEALACGCRLVATALPGVAEVLSGLAAGFVSLVDLPRLEGVDVPLAQDEPLFIDQLEKAMAGQIRAAARRPDIDLMPARSLLQAATWPEVFERVAAVYRRLTFSRPPGQPPSDPPA